MPNSTWKYVNGILLYPQCIQTCVGIEMKDSRHFSGNTPFTKGVKQPFHEGKLTFTSRKEKNANFNIDTYRIILRIKHGFHDDTI